MDETFKQELGEVLGQQFAINFSKYFDLHFEESFSKHFNLQFKENFPKYFDLHFQKAKEQLRDEFILLFNDGFEQLVRPELISIREEMATKKDLGHIVNRLKAVDTRLDVVERKVDKVLDNQVDNHHKLNTHETRLKNLESNRV
jgi:hypothetical protein